MCIFSNPDTSNKPGIIKSKKRNEEIAKGDTI